MIFDFYPTRIVAMFLIVLASTSSSMAAPEKIAYATAKKITAPRYLYSWVPASTIRQMYDREPSGSIGEFFKPLDPDVRADGKQSAFVQSFPQLKSRSAVYAWTNPATAVRGANGEAYGEILVRFEMHPAAPAVELKTSDAPGFHARTQFQDLPAMAENVLFLHEGTVREWVITGNAMGSIRRFTADPEEMREVLEREIRKISDPLFHYEPRELHYDAFDLPADPNEAIVGHTARARNYALFRMRQFLKFGAKIVPHTYLKSENRGQVSRAKIEAAQNSASLTSFLAEEKAALERSQLSGLLSFRKIPSEVLLSSYQSDANEMLDAMERASRLLSIRLENVLKEERETARRKLTDDEIKKQVDDFIRPLATAFNDIYGRQLTTGKIHDEVKPQMVVNFLTAAADESTDPNELVRRYAEMVGKSGRKKADAFKPLARHPVSKALKSQAKKLCPTQFSKLN